ncbi:MAG: outer membrane protein transport protein [Victivallales bacterium]|nr:outer membrane protein transport protein [Victivallales bacterium]
MKKLSAILLMSLIVTTASLQGAGLSILEQSVSGLGRGLSGMAASSGDPSALYFNPAAGAGCETFMLTTGMHVLTGDVQFHDGGSTLSGKKSGDIVGTSFIPNLDAVLPIGDGLTLNMAMSATSGTATKYDARWTGRYFSTETSISVLEIAPSVSYRINDEWAVGIGFLAQYCDVLMKQNLNTTDVMAAYGLPGRDSRLKMEGDGWAFGFTAGILYKPTKTTTFGLGYRSSMQHNVKANARVTDIPPALASMQGLSGTSYHDHARIAMDQPQSITFGIRQEVTDKLTLMADIAWTDWSTLKDMPVKFHKGSLTGKYVANKMEWHDSWRFSIGAEYALTEKWTLRCGFTFDERTVTVHSEPPLKAVAPSAVTVKK